MFRGVSAQFSGCGPAHAAYFSCYEGMKHTLIAGRAGHHPAAHAGAGALATLAHDGLMTPFDVVKQRMQLDAADATGQRYKHFVQCARHVYRSEGAGAFFLSLRTTVPSPHTTPHATCLVRRVYERVGNDPANMMTDNCPVSLLRCCSW